MSFKVSLLLSYLFFCLHLANAATGQGSVSLWSNSDCAQSDTLAFSESVFIGKVTPDTDKCADLSRAAHSYRVSDRPTCDNGTTAAFAFYNGHNCKAQGFGPALNSFIPSDKWDGECFALVEFRSVAFVCDGVGQSSEQASGTASSSETAPSTSVSEPSSTTLIESSPYTLPNVTASGYGGPIGTVSALPSQTGGLSPSPSPFTGSASKIQVSTLGTILLAFRMSFFNWVTYTVSWCDEL